MIAVFQKELTAFFSSLIGYMTIGVFLLLLGLIIWVFPDYSILYYNYATLDQLFEIAPFVFLFLIPAITMRSFAEERQNRTLEVLESKPITTLQIILGKYLACFCLVVLALVPTLLYYYSVYQLGSPVGNIDSGAVLGSYLGLLMLAGSFTAIGVFASAITQNQIVAFLTASFLCFIFYWGFMFISKLPSFIGKIDDFIIRLGLEHHYQSISQGLIDTRDIVYFLSFISVFVALTHFILKEHKG